MPSPGRRRTNGVRRSRRARLHLRVHGGRARVVGAFRSARALPLHASSAAARGRARRGRLIKGERLQGLARRICLLAARRRAYRRRATCGRSTRAARSCAPAERLERALRHAPQPEEPRARGGDRCASSQGARAAGWTMLHGGEHLPLVPEPEHQGVVGARRRARRAARVGRERRRHVVARRDVRARERLLAPLRRDVVERHRVLAALADGDASSTARARARARGRRARPPTRTTSRATPTRRARSSARSAAARRPRRCDDASCTFALTPKAWVRRPRRSRRRRAWLRVSVCVRGASDASYCRANSQLSGESCGGPPGVEAGGAASVVHLHLTSDDPWAVGAARPRPRPAVLHDDVRRLRPRGAGVRARRPATARPRTTHFVKITGGAARVAS